MAEATKEEQIVAAPARRSPDQPSICFVTTDFAGVIRNGGIGTYFWLMSRLLAGRGWNVHVLFCGQVDDEEAMAKMPARMASEGVSFTWLEELPAPSWKKDDIPTYADGMHDLWLSQLAMEALEKLHAEHAFDIIEFADWRALGFRSAQAKRSGLAFDDVALAVKLHSTTDWQRRGNLANRKSAWDLKLEWCERYAFERADLQLSPSRYMVEDTLAHGWEVRDDVLVGCPFPEPEPEPTVQTAEVRKLAFFGRLERRKGLDIFLDALDSLPAELPVIFLGRDTRIEGQSAKEIIRERLGDRPFEIEDELDREAALAKLASGEMLAVIASQSETFGYTAAECIANRIPFVAACAGGIPEVLRHSEARRRWLFEPTAGDLAIAIERRLAADANTERKLRLEASESCDHERWNDELEAAYRQTALRFREAHSTARGRTTEESSVSVGVAHYNHAAFLPSALASLANQTRQPDEVIVIDDGSTDPEALEVFASMEALYPEWTFLRQENAGPGAARNRCLELATGSYFLPFDSDNIARPELVETLLGAMQTDPSRDVATCQTLAFVEEADIEAESFAFRYAPTGGPRIVAPLENVFGDTCALFRSDVLRTVGGFETDPTSPHEDWETYAKIAFAGFDIDVVPRPLFWYRTKISGRLETLGEDPADKFRLRRRIVEEILADVKLDGRELIALWECLIAFAAPNEDVAFLQRAHDEVAEWAEKTLADANAWHEQHLADNVARYEHLLVGASNPSFALETVPVKRLWLEATRRTLYAIRRRGKAILSRNGGHGAQHLDK